MEDKTKKSKAKAKQPLVTVMVIVDSNGMKHSITRQIKGRSTKKSITKAVREELLMPGFITTDMGFDINTSHVVAFKGEV